MKTYSCPPYTNKNYHKIIISAFFLFAPFFYFNPCSADDQIPHTTVKKDDVTTEVACAVKDYTPKEAEDLCLSCTEKSWRGVSKDDVSVSSKVIEVAVLSIGKGTEFRHWEPQDIVLVVDGKKIKPCGTDKFYVPKESAAKDIAVAVFVGLGSQHEEDASCYEGGEKRGETAKAIDRAGMAAGLGLLVSSSKGEITGLKARFKIPGGQDAIKSARVEAKILNTDTHKKMTVDAKMQYAVSVSQAASNALPAQTFNVAR